MMHGCRLKVLASLEKQQPLMNFEKTPKKEGFTQFIRGGGALDVPQKCLRTQGRLRGALEVSSQRCLKGALEVP